MMNRVINPVKMDKNRRLVNKKIEVRPIPIKIKGRPSLATGNLLLILVFSRCNDDIRTLVIDFCAKRAENLRIKSEFKKV